MLDGMSRHNVRRDCEDTRVSRHVVQEVETAVQPIANINECQVHIPAGQPHIVSPFSHGTPAKMSFLNVIAIYTAVDHS